MAVVIRFCNSDVKYQIYEIARSTKSDCLREGGSVFETLRPLRGPIPHVSKHSFKASFLCKVSALGHSRNIFVGLEERAKGKRKDCFSIPQEWCWQD